MATEIVLPRIFQEVAFTSIAEQVPSITINLPGKTFAVPEYGIEIDATRAAQLYTHTEYGISDGASAASKWTTVRRYPGQTPQNVADSIPHHPDFMVMAQIIEDLYAQGETNVVAFMDDAIQRIFNATGMSDPADTNIVGDYYDSHGLAPSLLGALMAAPGTTLWNDWRTRFSSESNARKDRNNVTSGFFTRNSYLNRNWMVTGYLDGWHRVPEHAHVYGHIAEIEQMHLAVRRKTFQFAWDILEGAEWKLYRHGSFQSIRFENPAGTIFKNTLNGVPPEMMYRQGLINSTIGDGMIHWQAAARTKHDISRWLRSHNGGLATWKTKWLKDGQINPVDYNFNDPTQPARSPGDNPLNYTDNNVQIIPPSFYGPNPYGIHDALAGRYMAELTKTKHTTLHWRPFTYKINGGSEIDGYFNGENPVLGTLGDGSLSTLNNRNFGQHNIVNQFENKKPICWKGTDVAHFCFPTARPGDEIEVTIDHAGTHTLEVQGPGWRTFDL